MLEEAQGSHTTMKKKNDARRTASLHLLPATLQGVPPELYARHRGTLQHARLQRGGGKEKQHREEGAQRARKQAPVSSVKRRAKIRSNDESNELERRPQADRDRHTCALQHRQPTERKTTRGTTKRERGHSSAQEGDRHRRSDAPPHGWKNRYTKEGKPAVSVPAHR